MVGWLCYATRRQRGHLETAPHLLFLAKDVKLGFYTIPTGKKNPGPSRCSPLHIEFLSFNPRVSNQGISCKCHIVDQEEKLSYWIDHGEIIDSELKCVCIYLSAAFWEGSAIFAGSSLCL